MANCTCVFCTKEYPKYKEMRQSCDVLQLQQYIEELFDNWQMTGHDLDIVKAKLDGSWPGWEWVKEKKKADPELLAALKKASQGYRNLVEMDILPISFYDDARAYWEEMDSIIAKAEGR